MKLFTKWLRLKPKITQIEAIEIAKAMCERLSWPWLEPIQAKYSFGKWVVDTNCGQRGANVKIIIDGENGNIINSNFLPR